MEFNGIEIVPLTSEQWERLISYHHVKCGKSVTQVLISARKLQATMERIQLLAGHSQEDFDEVSRALLDMAHEEDPPKDKK